MISVLRSFGIGVISFLILYLLLPFVFSSCERRRCVPPEFGGSCVIPSYCVYDGIALISIIVISLLIVIIHWYKTYGKNRIKN